jgi:glutathione S-transferase
MSNIEVFVWAAAEGLPSTSPFCLKVIYALRLKELPHTITVVDRPPDWATRQKLPVIEIDGERIEDSTTILKRLDVLFPDTPRLYPTLSQQKAEVLLVEEWADQSLYWFLVLSRWSVDANFDRFASIIFGKLPPHLQQIIPPAARENNLTRLGNLGLLQLTPEERYERVREVGWILEQRLASNPYLSGEVITAADLSVFPVIQLMITCEFVDLVGLFDAFPQLKQWLARLEKQLATT